MNNLELLEIKEAKWALDDLLRIKENKSFTEYVTQQNIDVWIVNQSLHLRRILWRELQVAFKYSAKEKQEIKSLYDELLERGKYV